MLHFRMNMPFYLMALYGSVMIVAVLLLRALLKNRLPKFVFPVLWGVVLLRLLVPFSISSPLSLPVPAGLLGLADFSLGQSEATAVTEDVTQPQPGTSGPQTVATDTAEDTMAPRDGMALAKENGDGRDKIGTVTEDTEYAISQEGVGPVVDYGYGLTGIFRWRNLLPAAYFLGLALIAGILGWQKNCYARKLRGSLLVEHNETVNGMLREMGMGHVLVFTNDEIASPLVSGLLNPCIYLPTGMDFGNAVLLGHVLAHEAMHVRRRDSWLKCVMLAALILHWYNPLVWIMVKCLASDLEAACDAAVLKKYDGEERKSYAFSLLAMAITGSRATLLYSAFSKTEVERRVKGILNYRKATAFALLVSVLFLLGSTAVFATGGQAPFSSYLTGFCYSSNCSWGVRATLARDIALGKDAQKRAEDAVLAVMSADATGDPEILEEGIRAALADVFGVERSAFRVSLSLMRDAEALDKEYESWGITKGEDGFWLYQEEQVRTYRDEMLGSYQSREDGPVDIAVERNRLGEITAVTAWHAGDAEYDRRTRERGQYGSRYSGTDTDQGYETQ